MATQQPRPEDTEPWPLKNQRVALETLPPSLARAFAAEGIVSWDEVEAINDAQLLSYPGVGRKWFRWLQFELRRRRCAVRYTQTGYVQIKLVAPLNDLKYPKNLPSRAGVYFIQCGPFVKIGLARCVRSRFEGLQQSIPFQLDLLGVVEPTPGQSLRDTEKSFHQRFRAHRQVGEWFRMDGELDSFCLTLASMEAGVV